MESACNNKRECNNNGPFYSDLPSLPLTNSTLILETNRTYNSMVSSCSLSEIEKCQISPPSGSVVPVSLPMTVFDVIWLPLPPVQRLFFFEHQCSRDQFTNTILPKIKHSLSLALQHFFPLAANLTWPPGSSRPEVLYVEGDSVLFTVAESSYDFDALISNDPTHVSAFEPLVPLLTNSPAEKRFPLTSLLVTLFPEKGISIGITYSHVVADGRAFLRFLRAWASICESSSIVLQPPCVSRSLLVKEDPDHETDLAISNYLKKYNFSIDTFYIPSHHLAGTDKVFATFVMSRAEINRLKQWVLSNINKEENAPPLHLSTFVLTCAYVWVCSIKAQPRESVAEDEMEYFLFPVDCRARLDPPLPATYFGSCVGPALVRAKASDLMGEHGILIAAELIGNAIRDIERGNAILKGIESFFSYFSTLPPRILSATGSPQFGAYDADFGWGKPRKAQVISIATTGAISLSECPSEAGAVEVGLARDKVEMDAFSSLFKATMQGFPPSN